MSRGSAVRWLAAACLLFGPGPSAGASNDPARAVSARVIDSHTGEPLSEVVVAAGSSVATTDAGGRFTMAVGNDSSLVTLHRIGYRPLTVRASELAVEVALQRSPVVLTSLQVTASAAGPSLGRLSQLAITSTTREALAARSAPALAEALEATEGISTSRPGGWGAKAYLRGLGGERVVVLLDGNRLNRACNMGMDGGLSTVNPDNVERVEVLSGPGSTLYGSGNLGGVINIVTRAPRATAGLQGEIRMVGSSAVPGGRLGGTLWGRGDRIAFTASADAASYGNQRSPRGTVPASSFRDATMDLMGSYRAQEHRLDARVQRYAGRDIGYPGSGARIPEEDRLLASVDYGAQLSRGILDGVNVKAFLQSLDHHMVMSMTMPASMPGGTPMRSDTDARSNSDTWGGRVQARLTPRRSVHVDAGLDATRWNAEGTRWVERTVMGGTVVTAYRTWPGVRLTDLGSFAQGSALMAPWLEGSAGVRADRVLRRAEGFDRSEEWVASGNAGVRVFRERGPFARASLGFGYRVPDPTELYGLLLRPDGYVYRGDPDLRTETSRNVEVSAGWDGTEARASITAYRNRVHDYVSTMVTGDSLSGTPVRKYANVADARVDGITASASADPRPWVSIRASAGVARGEDAADGAPLAMTPPLEGSAAVRIAPRSVPWIEPEVIAAARQTRVARGEAETPGFMVWSLRAGHSFGRSSVILGVENVFDTAYRRHLDPVRTLRPGRNVFVRLSQPL